ncbi:IclR family transcriptional regulator [Saccharothrix sp. ALI-22-I]|uniref:IclR family transcriptional regulator domain-containing protein n=1 Tax=Saccharothrix sp. ALI-22-I TaxID=1933778 RepID=UPI00097BE5BF|nr:IclR family transcriptional regulator C-terminal domain-containing protein [Saccharothrix sp. ALI-22-I]ONI89673.1 IclR family transcriptional regulator [Saccharothrix sp. ALI-22-I]
MVEPPIGRREDHGPHFVQSVARALAVMRSFTAARPRQTLAQVARETGLDRATARRLLLTLADLGYVAGDSRGFELTPRVLELGYAYLSGLSLPEIVYPHLRKLAGELNETAALAVLDGDEIVYVALVPSTRLATVRINIGTRFKAYATSMGRVLLAGLSPAELDVSLSSLHLETRTDRTVRTVDMLREEIDKARAQGWALVDSELEHGLRGAAAPVRDRAGRVVAAANVSVHAGRTTPELVEREYVPAILRTVRMIEADMMGLH